ncbi:NnrU family protein [Roseibium sp. HPY-6]|uniref:NnrU family protein n=1 Tax=Roseibium sp. HPY-6 TaxID=3229852 RepID=UPI00338E5185
MIDVAWGNFIAAFAAFFASHMILIRPPVKPVIVRVLTHRGFSAAYSLLSILILWWLIDAAGSAPYVELWSWAPWQNWIPRISMLPACLILTLGVATPNPFSFGGMHNSSFDPKHPGIVRYVRHPILLSAALWSVAHIPPNGNLAHVVLFGTFALFSLLGMKLVDRRRRHEMNEEWLRLQRLVKAAPHGIVMRSNAFQIRVLWGFLLYGVLVGLHPVLTDIDPFA